MSILQLPSWIVTSEAWARISRNSICQPNPPRPAAKWLSPVSPPFCCGSVSHAPQRLSISGGMTSMLSNQTMAPPLTCPVAVELWEFFLDQKPKVLGTKRLPCSWPANVCPDVISANGFIAPGAVAALGLITRIAPPGSSLTRLVLPGAPTAAGTSVLPARVSPPVSLESAAGWRCHACRLR
jgi:hypothetical protein